MLKNKKMELECQAPYFKSYLKRESMCGMEIISDKFLKIHWRRKLLQAEIEQN